MICIYIYIFTVALITVGFHCWFIFVGLLLGATIGLLFLLRAITMNVGIGVAYMSRLGMDIPRKEPLGNVQNCVLDSGFGKNGV